MVRSRGAHAHLLAAPAGSTSAEGRAESQREMDGAGREELGEACCAAGWREQLRGSSLVARCGAESGAAWV